MARLAIVSMLMVALLAGCGQVIVFGHVIGEKPATVEPSAAGGAAPAAGAAPASGAASASASPSTGAAAPAASSQSAAATTPPPSAPSASATLRTASSTAEPPPASPTPSHTVKSITLTVTPEAAAKITGDASRFSQDALLDALRSELTSRKLLDEQNPQVSGTAVIIVDDLATRPTTNAILFGYKMLAGTLEGDIRVTGTKGTESTGSRIVAESKLTLAVNGADKNPLGPLYRRFAVLAADRLAGVASKPQDPTGIPRF